MEVKGEGEEGISGGRGTSKEIEGRAKEKGVGSRGWEQLGDHGGTDKL